MTRVRCMPVVLMLGALAPEQAVCDGVERLPAEAEITLPSDTCRGLFIVPLALGEERNATLNVLLDTGSSGSYLDPRALARVVGDDALSGRADFEHASIGGFELGPLRVRALPLRRLSLALGREIDGILGFPAFRDVLLTLDYPDRAVRVARGRLPEPDGREVMRYRGSKRPFIRLDVGGRRVKALLDSGSTGRFLLPPSNLHSWIKAPREAHAIWRVQGLAIEQGGRLDGTIRVGPLRFENPVVTLSRSEPVIGWHVLRHFALTFDQRRKRVKMSASSAGPVRMPPWTGSGLAYRPRSDGLEVIRVFRGTPAEKSGIRVGDVIVAIDGVPVHERGCSDPAGTPAGRRLLMTYRRAGARADAEVVAGVLVP